MYERHSLNSCLVLLIVTVQNEGFYPALPCVSQRVSRISICSLNIKLCCDRQTPLITDGRKILRQTQKRRAYRGCKLGLILDGKNINSTLWMTLNARKRSDKVKHRNGHDNAYVNQFSQHHRHDAP